MFKTKLERMNPAIEQMRIIVDPHPLRRDEPNTRWCVGYAWPSGRFTFFTNRPTGEMPQHGLTEMQLELCTEQTRSILGDPDKLAEAMMLPGDEEAKAAIDELRNAAEDRGARKALAAMHAGGEKPDKVSVPLTKDAAGD